MSIISKLFVPAVAVTALAITAFAEEVKEAGEGAAATVKTKDDAGHHKSGSAGGADGKNAAHPNRSIRNKNEQNRSEIRAEAKKPAAGEKAADEPAKPTADKVDKNGRPVVEGEAAKSEHEVAASAAATAEKTE
jgi:hypothetical protein